MNKLHPGARWIFRIKAFWSFLFLVIFVGVFIGSFVLNGIDDSTNRVLSIVFMILLPLFVLMIIIIEIYARMSYNRWFYEIGQDSIRLERGIIWKRYSNVPYERVQNVDITRGIIARICGFSTLMIQTAGYSAVARGGYGSSVEGYIPAVSSQEAEKIREYVLKKIKGKNSGL